MTQHPLRDKTAVVGIGSTNFARNIGRTEHQTAIEAITKACADAGLPVKRVNKVTEGRPHCVDVLMDGGIQLVINTTEGAQAITDSFSLRRMALQENVPYYTTVAGARAAVEAIETLISGVNLEVAPLQSYFNSSF